MATGFRQHSEAARKRTGPGAEARPDAEPPGMPGLRGRLAEQNTCLRGWETVSDGMSECQSSGDHKEDVDRDDSQWDACHLLRSPAYLRGVREDSRTDLKVPLCVKQELTSQGKRQTPTPPPPTPTPVRTGWRELWPRGQAEPTLPLDTGFCRARLTVGSQRKVACRTMTERERFCSGPGWRGPRGTVRRAGCHGASRPKRPPPRQQRTQ